MGNSSYSFMARDVRASTEGYFTKSTDETFQQNKKREMHDSMNPRGIVIREARDSEVHPSTVPIILALDVTGSMGSIPVYMIKDGLPKLMSGIIQNGVPDPALLFLAIGDHENDHCPLQVGQFESGDAELDTWLTRTYIEGRGGANAGESYLLAWYFAAKHTATDAWDKRHQKGFLFTTGDEPCLSSLPQNALKGIMGDSAVSQGTYTAEDLLKAAQERWNVYHLHIMEGSAGHRSYDYWNNLLGQNCIQVDDYTKVSDIMAKIIYQNAEKTAFTPSDIKSSTSSTAAPTSEDML